MFLIYGAPHFGIIVAHPYNSPSRAYMIMVVASRRFALILVTSLLVAFAVFAVGEVAIRLLVKPTIFGMALGKMELAPKDWNAGRAHMREVWEKGSGDLSYQVYDAQLGWKPRAQPPQRRWPLLLQPRRYSGAEPRCVFRRSSAQAADSRFGRLIRIWREGEIRRRISVAARRAPRSSVSGPEFWRAGLWRRSELSQIYQRCAFLEAGDSRVFVRLA